MLILFTMRYNGYNGFQMARWTLRNSSLNKTYISRNQFYNLQFDTCGHDVKPKISPIFYLELVNEGGIIALIISVLGVNRLT